ncbi:MAG: hypothetical protein R3310_13930 [Candidatus Competibacteraceae bacterium]|nr:hypothetical protein [Candidatus Competibacteraceae bacterium]
MANLTIVVDEHTLQQARIRALQQGTSVNALVRDYLQAYVGGYSGYQQATSRLLELARASRATSGGRTWQRDDIYER